MVFFEQLSTSLKQKWLQYYQKNRSWLILHMTDENTIQTPDGGRRPVSYLILGILNALEPELEALMLPFSKLKADADSLVEVLGLNFDPDIAIGEKPTLSPFNNQGDTILDPQGSEQPVRPDQDEDSGNLSAAVGVAGGTAALVGVAAVGSEFDQDSNDLLDGSSSDLDLEADADDDLDLGMESTAEADELDMELDSDSDADDGLDLELESTAEAVDDLGDIDLSDMDGDSSDPLDIGEDGSDFVAEDIPDPFEDTSAKLDESDLDELGNNDVYLLGKDDSDDLGDLELGELGDDNQFDDLSSDDLGDLDLDLDGEGLDLDEADLDSLAGEKKSSNDDDFEGLLG